MKRDHRIAVVFGATLGAGGLGAQCGNAIAGARASGLETIALGPASDPSFASQVEQLSLRSAPKQVPGWARRLSWLRWNTGRLQLMQDVRLGHWAARQLETVRPSLCYVFTQVGLETLRWARANGVPSILETPNGHIRNFRGVYEAETRRWGSGHYWGHPTDAMVARVEEEYRLADHIRVSSTWARNSLISYGIPSSKITVLQQSVDIARFSPGAAPQERSERLRLVFVGSLDLRKGFPYLLDAVRRAHPHRFRLSVVGATGDRACRRLFARLREGLPVEASPGDPLPALRASELFVFPTLEDGSPFAVAEAMACGLPVIVTRACGAAEWVEPGRSGWIVAERSAEELAEALDVAFSNREGLHTMGLLAREDTTIRADPARCATAVGEWLSSRLS